MLGSEKKAPYFSIVVPVLNRRRELPSMFSSVEAQQFKDYELIVVDNGSTDGSYELSVDHAGARVFRCERRGPGLARNLGISQARGQWIVLLDSDNKFINSNTLGLIRDRIEMLGSRGGGFWFKVISDSGLCMTWFATELHDKKIGLPEYLAGLSGEVAHVICASWFKANLYPEIEGTRIEFAELVWMKLAVEEGIVLVDDVVQVYGTTALNRVCVAVVDEMRARELFLYNKLLYETYGRKILALHKQRFLAILSRMILYGIASRVLSRAESVSIIRMWCEKDPRLLLLSALVPMPAWLVLKLLSLYKAVCDRAASFRKGEGTSASMGDIGHV